MLEAAIRQQQSDPITLCVADTKTLEVSLTETWMTVDPEGESRIFLTVLGDRTESLMYHLWQQASGNTFVIQD